MKIYLAGPISGYGYKERVAFFESKAKPLRRAGYTVLHPLLGKGHLRNEIKFRAHSYEHPVSTNHAIFERDYWMVTQADIILADLSSATRVSVGTMFELAWAQQLSKHTLVILPVDDRLHRHAFVLEAADIVFDTVSAAMAYLRGVLKHKEW
jgi:nucleoside 2-deoxyribosyltransferase